MVRLKEFRVKGDELDGFEAGSEVPIDLFKPGDFVDVTGVSIGKGTAGVIKRHKFSGAPGGHGTHEFFRHGGSIGNNTTPGTDPERPEDGGPHGQPESHGAEP